MKYETAGDPVSGLRWTRKTTEKIAGELSARDHSPAGKDETKATHWSIFGAANHSVRTL